jgi:hypothetical protein
VDDRALVAGGYFLVRPGAEGDRYGASDLLPERVLSLSSCIADFALTTWWSLDNAVEAVDFGVDERRLSDLVDWYRAHLDSSLGFPNVAFDRSVIGEFVHEFVDDPSDLRVIGGAISRLDTERLLAFEQAVASADLGRYGVCEMLERNLEPDAGGVVVGYEPVSFQYGLECSWLCNGLESGVAASLGFGPDPSTGLVAAIEDAARLTDLVNEGHVGAEPGLWLPWQLSTYELRG